MALTPCLLSRLASSLRSAGVVRAGTVAVALSGGPDSLALAALFARWQHDQQEDPAGAGPGAAALALVVDHGLRAESTEEAAAVAGTAARLGLVPHVLRVDWARGRPRLQDKLAAARDARYGLLIEAASRTGRKHLLVAHHADDQAETFMLRLLHASGVRGLGCMPLVSTALSGGSGVLVVRPLLGARKAELERYCEREGLGFVLDPTNADLSFARNRLRHLMRQQQPAQQQDEGSCMVEDVLRLQATCAEAAAWQQAAVAALLRQAVLLLTPELQLPSLPAAWSPRDAAGAAGGGAPIYGGGTANSAGIAAMWAAANATGREGRVVLSTLAERLASRLPLTTHFAFFDAAPFGLYASRAVCVATLSELLGAVSGSKYPASTREGERLAAAVTGGRLHGKYTGGGCYVQPIPGSKGRLCIAALLEQQAAVYGALQGALKQEKAPESR